MKGFHPFKLPTFTVLASQRRGNPRAFLEIASGLMPLAMTKGRRFAMTFFTMTRGTTKACSQFKVEDTLIL